MRITFLLGAGAANDWGGKLSPDIRELFINAPYYKAANGISSLGAKIFEILDGHYYPSSVNFETFLSFLEEILIFKINLGAGRNVNVNSIGLNSVLFEIKKENIDELKDPKKSKNKEERTYFKEVLNYYKGIVVDMVSHYEGKFSNSGNDPKIKEEIEEMNNACSSWIKYLKKDNKIILRFYTINYDDFLLRLPENKIEFFNGFYTNTVLSSEEHSENDLKFINYNSCFKYDYKKLRDKNLDVFYNLHGCIHWDICNNQLICRPGREIKELDYTTTDLANQGERFINSNIIVGYSKVQKIYTQPINSFFNSFQNDCNETDFLVLIGYSFSDTHLNKIISYSLKFNNSKILNITPSNNGNLKLKELIGNNLNTLIELPSMKFKEYLKEKKHWNVFA